MFNFLMKLYLHGSKAVTTSALLDDPSGDVFWNSPQTGREVPHHQNILPTIKLSKLYIVFLHA